MDRLVEEDAVGEELVDVVVDVVVVDVRIVAEDLMALKMRLLVVDAVMWRLIEVDVDVDLDVGLGRRSGRVSNVDRQRLIDAFEDGDDYHELAALPGIPYQTARSIIRVWLAEGRVQRLPQGGARNIKLTDDMQAFIRDFVLQQPFTTIAAVGQELAVRFPDTAISNSTIARHLQNQLITTKIAGKDSDVPFERNRPNTIERRFQYATWLVNLGQYSHLPVCTT